MVSRALAVLAALAALGTMVSGCVPADVAAPSAPPAVSPSIPVIAAAGGAHCHAVNGRADRACTPGAPNPQVTQLNIGSTICQTGWTTTIRPPVAFTEKLKQQQMVAYGLTGQPLTAVEEDHLLPLELGGAPADPRNLWPELWNGASGAHTKDGEENSLRRAVCGGRMKLADAQAKIIADWTWA